jgi:hypothetical protein
LWNEIEIEGLEREIGATDMDDAGGILAAVVCALLVFAIFPLLLWRRRSDAATAAGDNHRLPPQPLEVPPYFVYFNRFDPRYPSNLFHRHELADYPLCISYATG